MIAFRRPAGIEKGLTTSVLIWVITRSNRKNIVLRTAEIKKDATKEYRLGDVDEEVFTSFIEQLDKEVDFENQKLYM